MRTAARARWLVWLAPVVGVWLVVSAYRTGYDAEYGSRAGAEPEVVGIFFALPFVTLAIVLAGCASASVLVRSTGSRRAWIGAAVVLCGVGVLGALAPRR